MTDANEEIMPRLPPQRKIRLEPSVIDRAQRVTQINTIIFEYTGCAENTCVGCVAKKISPLR